MKPRVGEQFVTLESSPGEYGEELKTIVEVLEEVLPGVWKIGYRDGPITDPKVTALAKSLGIWNERWQQTHRLVVAITRGADGRWHAVREHYSGIEEV